MRKADNAYFGLFASWVLYFKAGSEAPFKIGRIVTQAAQQGIQLDAKTIDMAITAPQANFTTRLAQRVIESQRLTPRQYALALLNGVYQRFANEDEAVAAYDILQREKGMTEGELEQAKNFYTQAIQVLGANDLTNPSMYAHLLASVPDSYEQDCHQVFYLTTSARNY